MPFDIEGARKAGYSDQEIADHLAEQNKFDAAGARKAGYSDADILGHLSATQPPKPERGISLPYIGRPSLVGMVKGLLEAGKSAATLPGDVYAGKVDPLSDEGIKRSMEMASLVALAPSRPSVATRGATAAPLTSKALQDTAGESYNAIKSATRGTPLEEGAMAPFATELADYTAKNAPSEMRSGLQPVYDEINKIGQVKNAGQLVEIRRNLRDIKNAGGEAGNAAGTAMNRLDFEIEKQAPGTVAPLKAADKNYAISKRAQELEQKIKDAQLKAETTGTAGTHIRNAFRNEMTGGGDRFMSPEVSGAMSDVISPGAGTRLLRGMSLMDPSRHPWMNAVIGAPAALHSGGASLIPQALTAATGFASRKMYDRILRKRAEDAVRATLEEAPANAALNPGYQARARVGVSPPGGYLSQPGIPLLSALQDNR